MQTLNTIINFNHDNAGNIYIAADIPSLSTEPCLEILKKHLSEHDFFAYTLKQKQRDRNTYHMTIIAPNELNTLSRSATDFIGYPLVIHIIGIGQITEPDNVVYFLVCGCDEAQKIRKYFGLPIQNFHITLAFKQHDIFDKPKDKTSLIPPFNYINI